MRVQGFLIYRIWYGNCLVYVGRTKQPLQSRIRGHLFSKPMHRTVNIEQVTKIEYAELGSEADMNLYEIYYILRLHPPLNVDDKARDDLSVTLQCDGVPTRLHHRPRLYGQPVPEERTGRPLWQRRLPADGCGCCKGQLPRIRRQSGRHHHDNGRPVGHGGGVERSKTWTKRN